MINRKFAKPFDETLMQAYVFHGLFLDNKAAFLNYSSVFADPFAQDFMDEILFAREIADSIEQRGEQGVALSDMKTAMADCCEIFRRLIYHVDIGWNGDSAVLNTFGSLEYEAVRKSPLKLINLLVVSAGLAESPDYKSRLIATGFSQSDIDSMKTKAETLREKYLDYREIINGKSLRASERRAALNAVWERMKTISAASKMIYKDSPGRKKMFLLYPERKVKKEIVFDEE